MTHTEGHEYEPATIEVTRGEADLIADLIAERLPELDRTDKMNGHVWRNLARHFRRAAGEEASLPWSEPEQALRAPPRTRAEWLALHGLQWSGSEPVPTIGTVVRTNDIGAGRVVGYFQEDGWLGVRVALAKPPQWWVDANPGETQALLFGVEVSAKGGAS